MQRRRIEVRSQRRARLRALRLGHLWVRSYWFGCRWGKREGRLSSLPNEMRTKLGLLDVGSTWFTFPEVARNILTDLLLERNRSRKFALMQQGKGKWPEKCRAHAPRVSVLCRKRYPGSPNTGVFVVDCQHLGE